MRFGLRVVLCLFAAIIVGSGCRKALTPNIDRNQAPETWITAAPFDTVTARDKDGNPIFPPIDIGDHTIPVRFHMYWAGADKDGAVAGYYWAVVETSIVSEDGGIPPLPGPKPQDYHFTTKTDSIFIFRVAENVRDRPHGFFIYAVDNQGKPDPTPARFLFIASDNYPPQPVVEIATGTDTIVHVEPGGALRPEVVTVTVHDSLPSPLHTYPPTDTVPARSVLNFRWSSRLRIAGSNVVKYSYKLDEPAFVPVDSSVHTVTYNSGIPDPVTHHLNTPIAPGLKVFTLRAIDQAGGSGETTRRFIMNFSPDTWWSGPDPALFPATPQDPVVGSLVRPDGNSVQVTNFTGWSGIQGTYLSADSTRDRPTLRPTRNTFMEIWKDRIWVRGEGDTVHLNSWVVLWNGGYDKDSPYTMRIDANDPLIQGLTGDVVTNAGRVGSPIGFRALVVTRLDPQGSGVSGDTQSGLYPIYEPASVFRKPTLFGYWNVTRSGKAYALVQAEDADGGRDRTVEVSNLLSTADNVDQGGGTPAEREYRRKILVFYVNKAPIFNTLLPSFKPRPDGSNGVSPTPTYAVCPGGNWDMNMPAYDIDPFVSSDGPGGPSQVATFSLRLTFHAFRVDSIDSNGATYGDTTWTYTPSNYPSSTSFNVPIPREIRSGTIEMIANLCDCTDCRVGGGNSGAGRCVDFGNFHFRYLRLTSGCTEPADASSSNTLSRPGSDSPNRSQSK